MKRYYKFNIQLVNKTMVVRYAGYSKLEALASAVLLAFKLGGKVL